MGDLNGVDIAQATHEAALYQFGAMVPGEVVRYHASTPNCDVWEATYVDDHHVSQKLPRDRLHCIRGAHADDCPRCALDKGSFRDVDVLEQADKAYAHFGMTKNDTKSYRLM